MLFIGQIFIGVILKTDGIAVTIQDMEFGRMIVRDDDGFMSFADAHIVCPD